MTAPGSCTLILGGARSGKSRHAETLIERLPPPWTYVATAQALDEEMRQRIDHHRLRRKQGWETIDAPRDLDAVLAGIPAGRPLLLDCLTLWLSNLLLDGVDVDAASHRLAEILGRPRGPWVVVANEVGFGIVPDNALARRFRDAAGRLNQSVAARADRVLLVVAGIPIQVK